MPGDSIGKAMLAVLRIAALCLAVFLALGLGVRPAQASEAQSAATDQRDETVHLLALGDSLTQGYGLLEEDGFVPQMRQWLENRGHDVRLVNGGVSGDTTAGGSARVAWSLTPEIDAMIVALGGNDLLRGIDPDTVRANLEAILRVAREQDVAVMLVGMSAPANYGPAYKSAFDAAYPELAAKYDAVYAPSFFEGLAAEVEAGDPLSIDPASVSSFMQDDGIHPNEEGVRRIVEGLGPYVETLLLAVELE